MSKFPRLKAIREKLEKIFYGAGGKEENLKKAILTGRGNRNKEVPLSGFGNSEDACDYNEDDGLPTLLGIETYHSEEIGSLGEPATAASIAAATSALTAIAAIIKSLGPLKKGNKSDTTSAESSTSIETTSVTSTDNTGSGGSITNPAETSASTNNITDTTKTPTSGSANTADTPATETDSSSADSSQQDGNDERKKNPATTGTGKDKTPAKLSGFARAKDWASKNKLAAAGIGLASVATIAALTYGVHKLVTKNKGKKKENKGQAVSGAPKKRRFDANGKLRIQQLRF